MSIKGTDLLNALDRIAPFELAETWDNVGLLIGDPQRETRSVLLGLDPTLSLLKEAVLRGADTLITHHPCIFRPLSFVHSNSPDGAFVELALAKKINVIACHTNFDSATIGVSDALSTLLKLEQVQPLQRRSSVKEDMQGLGCIGIYPQTISFESFLSTVFAALQTESIHIAGKPPETIRTVAVCGGSGSDLAENAFSQGADVYLSAEIKHSTARWAEEVGFCVIDGTHYATERPAIALLEKQLQTAVLANNWNLKILQSESEQPVFTSRYNKNST